MFEKLVLASNNAGKLRELSALFAPLHIQLLPQGELGVPEADEPYASFVENALAKARHASRITGLPALADDSGLCVNALGGAPGVHSARFAGLPRSDARNNALLLTRLADASDRSAYYHAVLVLVRHAEHPQPLIAEGTWHGAIHTGEAGAGGFGYDPLFWCASHSCTVAQLSDAQKHALGHRGQAVRALVARLAAGPQCS
jgi:XTP/dITP diphosphohydrolase